MPGKVEYKPKSTEHSQIKEEIAQEQQRRQKNKTKECSRAQRELSGLGSAMEGEGKAKEAATGRQNEEGGSRVHDLQAMMAVRWEATTTEVVGIKNWYIIF